MSQHPGLPSSPMAGHRPPHLQGDAGPSALDLWIRPARFFSLLGKDRPRALVIGASILAGVTHAQERLDKQFLKASLGRASATVDALNSWGAYWGISLLLGATVSAYLVWVSYGWWYRTRLRWCGADGVDVTRTRDVAVLSSIVSGAPALLYGVYEAATYATPLESAGGDDLGGLLVLAFAFWSVFVSYTGAITLFPVRRARARFFFLVGPWVFYALALGAVGMLLALAGNAGGS